MSSTFAGAGFLAMRNRRTPTPPVRKTRFPRDSSRAAACFSATSASTRSVRGSGRFRAPSSIETRTRRSTSPSRLEASGAGGAKPWSGEIQVAAYLEPDGSTDFSHSFAMEVPEGSPTPQMRASVVWMRHEVTRTPDYTKAGGVPHPSNLPVEVGGVTGADLRPTPIQ